MKRQNWIFSGLTVAGVALLGLCLLPQFEKGKPAKFTAPLFQTITLGAPEISPTWLAQAQENIARQERRATLQEHDSKGNVFSEPRWHLMNRHSDVRVYFDNEGLEIQPREAEDAGPSWNVQMSLVGSDVSKIEGQGQTIFAQKGEIEERLENRDHGIEHSFLIRKGSSGPQTVEIDVQLEGLHVTAGGQDRIVFGDDTHDVLEYRDLWVTDATGKRLMAQMDWDGRQIEIALLEGGAYPILVDPLITTPGWTKESEQDGGLFGFSVATAGDVNNDGYSDVIVGAAYYDGGNTDEGRAFVYHGSASGLSTTAAWTKDGDQDNAHFGISVATAGDVNGGGYSDVIVGANLYDGGNTNEGRAFVYHGSSTGLSTTAAWTKDSDQDNANFGFTVATAGDVNNDGYSDVIVGAYLYDGGNTDEGRAFVYHGSSTGLSTTAAWTKDSDQDNAYFGYSAATAGDINGDGYTDVVVGAYLYDGGNSNEGRAFVYHGSSTGLISTVGWTKDSDQNSAQFGYSVATAGDVNGDGYADVIVGSNFYNNGVAGEGRATTYHGSSTGLSTTAAWSQTSGVVGGQFGYCVATAGDVNGDGYADVVVGAIGYGNGEADEGAAFVYHGSAYGLISGAASTLEGNQLDASMGWSVGTAGDVNGDGFSEVIASAPAYDNGNTDEGRAFVFHGAPANLSTTAAWFKDSNQLHAYMGYSVATAGDVNGDGYADAIVGAPNFDNGNTNEGLVSVYHGSSTGLTAAVWAVEGGLDNALYGSSVASAGDVNGDGYSDIIVGAPNVTNGQTDEGRVYVYHGSSTGLATTAPWTKESDLANTNFGNAVATAGDINSDGYSDVIIGAYLYENGQTNEGRVYVYHGSSAGLSSTVNWSKESDSTGLAFGYSAATAGDVNRDGYSDIIVGAIYYTNGQSNEGRAYVYHGSSTGIVSTVAWTKESDTVDANFGWSVATAGDINGDGYSDVLVGAPNYANGQGGEGRVYAFHGSSSGVASTIGWSKESNQTDANLGYSVATAGDLNSDGYSDVVVGAPYYDAIILESDHGKAQVYHGSASGLASTAVWTKDGTIEGEYFGSSVATAGDVNGDGFSDLLVGAYAFSDGQEAEGRVSLYYGNDSGGGVPVVPRQKRVTAGTLIQLLGKSDLNGTNQQISFLERVSSPAGRMRSRLILELDPLSSVFNGAGLERSSWSLPSLGGSDLSLTSSSISVGSHYHWRMRYQYFPFMNYSLWYSIGPNGWNEKDFRAAPSPAP